MKREVKAKVTIEIVRAPCNGAAPEDVVALAASRAEELYEQDGRDSRDSIWALIDREAESEKQKKADQAQKKSAGKNCTVILSRPCFEVWTLAHLVDIHFVKAATLTPQASFA